MVVVVGVRLLVSCVATGVVDEEDEGVLGGVLEILLVGEEDVLVEGDTDVVEGVAGGFVEDVVRRDVCSMIEEVDDVGIVEVVTG